MPGACDAEGGLVEARYANHFQIGHNEFEFIFDFGQCHASGGRDGADQAVPIVRIVMAPPFARALLVTLQRAMVEHEQTYGPVEQD